MWHPLGGCRVRGGFLSTQYLSGQIVDCSVNCDTASTWHYPRDVNLNISEISLGYVMDWAENVSRTRKSLCCRYIWMSCEICVEVKTAAVASCWTYTGKRWLPLLNHCTCMDHVYNALLNYILFPIQCLAGIRPKAIKSTPLIMFCSHTVFVWQLTSGHKMNFTNHVLFPLQCLAGSRYEWLVVLLITIPIFIAWLSCFPWMTQWFITMSECSIFVWLYFSYVSIEWLIDTLVMFDFTFCIPAPFTALLNWFLD